ncbi:MAG: FAD-dependent oxidoreductase, partial [Planctomycetes bacterium]|nr:FAD-dependent oxidoreductase [Planctomycetota bacterium]
MTGRDAFKCVTHDADLCVIGGGTAGVAAAVAAARHGATVVLMQDRPVLGGNASSECRVHICGADRHNGIPHKRETGLLEELRMLNLYRNPTSNFHIHDTLLWELAAAETRITLLLNCSCQDAAMDGRRIVSVTGWQLAAETYHTVRARWFADCSGDGILAPLTGAEFRMGREARGEYEESLAPETADARTMGHSIRFQTASYPTPQTFIPPPWAYTYERCEDLPYGPGGHGNEVLGLGFWWVELGGEHDTIADTPALRDELVKIAYGVWDHLKNHCPKCRQRAKYLNLEWIQTLPAKRESRRYVGPHVLTQNDLAGGGAFDDTVAYGGWSMDDHDPAGFRAVRDNRPPTLYHRCPSPYGIPLRSLYSRNIDNLLFAGRDMSATHMAMSSTRVMGTGMVCGQAVGTAVAMMAARGLTRPAELFDHVAELQQTLLWDDCFLPGVPLAVPALTRQATLTASRGDARPVRDGWSRQIDDDGHAWQQAGPGQWVQYDFHQPVDLAEVAIAFDTQMHLDVQMSWSNHCVGRYLTSPPATLAQRFTVECLRDGRWAPAITETNNIHRYCRRTLNTRAEAVRLRLDRFWGNVDTARLYTFV